MRRARRPLPLALTRELDQLASRPGWNSQSFTNHWICAEFFLSQSFIGSHVSFNEVDGDRKKSAESGARRYDLTVGFCALPKGDQRSSPLPKP